MAGATKKVQQGLQDSTSDIVKGTTQIAQGNIGTGIENYAAGTAGVMSGGLTQYAGLKGETQLTRAAQDQAAQDAADAAALAGMNDQQKKQKVIDKLKAMQQMREKSPGKGITLLTSSLVPNGTATGSTLLTQNAGKK